MKTKLSPAFIGAFVIGAMALLIIGVLSFGGVGFFSKPQRFLVYFDESVHGLDAGSPVKLRGVRVGRVANLIVRYDERSNRSRVAVVCELHRDVVTDNKGVVIDLADRAELESLVEKGLRAQLQVLGLATGLLYVELDFVQDPKLYPLDPNLRDPRYVVVPHVPSLISEVQKSVGEILTKVKRIDFEGLSRELTLLMSDSRRQLAGVDLKGVVDQWRKTGAAFEALADSPEIKQTLATMNLTLTELRGTIAKLDGQVAPTGQALAETLAAAKKAIASFDETAGVAKRFLASNSGMGTDVAATLQQLNEAAAAVTRLAEFLERNPNALLLGRPRPKQ